jgi:DNA polymerase-3 subunit gamma/tau
MLSGHSFNALLKTLEEPPEHVKFLLATTDPQKIPVTVLSRCLQFNLKRLLPEQISGQMEFILQQEQISYELPALTLLARAADGSLRDGLSLLDQAIVYGAGQVRHADVLAMLGTVAQQPVADILRALLKQDADALMQCVAEMATLSPDFSSVVQEMLYLLHRVAMYQVTPVISGQAFDPEVIQELAGSFTAEDVQLYYQLALIGRRDLAWAPDPKTGFEMLLLRMLAFRPVSVALPASRSEIVTVAKPVPVVARAAVAAPQPVTAPVKAVPEAQPERVATPLADNDWSQMIVAMKLEGMTRQLANNCVLEVLDASTCTLLVDAGHQHLCGGVPETKLQQALQKYRAAPALKLVIKPAQAALVTPATVQTQALFDKQQAAVTAMNTDTTVLALKEHFDARIMPGTIEPL